MKKLIACFAVFVLLVSFKSPEPKVYHYPDFIISYDEKILPGAPAFEGYANGVFVSGGAEDYLQGVDSIAVKYIVDHRDIYTNFYSRAGEGKWRKYGPNKKIFGVISEDRSVVSFLDKRNPAVHALYYSVR